jgi:hypothetical protein
MSSSAFVTRRKRLVAVALAAMGCLAFASPVAATIYERGHFADSGEFSYDDCGFVVNGTFEVRGVFVTRTGKGDLDTAFFAHVQSTFREVHVRESDGATIIVSAHALFQEVKAEPLGGNLFAFTSIQAGQPFVVTETDGNVLVRDRGVIRETIVFDTTGDHQPGGIYVEQLSFDWHGPHPGLFVDFCGLFDQAA